jgi:hypothetical protein
LFFLDFVKRTLADTKSLVKISTATEKLPAAALSGPIWLSDLEIGVSAVFFIF